MIRRRDFITLLGCVAAWPLAGGDGIANAHRDDRDRPRLPLDGNGRRGRHCQYDVGVQTDQLLRELL